MAPTMIPISDKPKKILVKSASLEHFVREDASSSDEEEERDDGARLSNGSIVLSPGTRRLAQRPSSSGMAEPRASGLSGFLVGNTQDDDVFTESVRAQERKNQDTVQVMTSPKAKRAPRSAAAEGVAKPRRFPVSIDAQHIYPPTACVFAANLPAPFGDHKLEVEVTKFFSRFGTVFVKIRRDERHMPFAFCQFTRDEDARNAELLSVGAKILGRPVRIEMAKANSSWIVSKRSGKETSEHEAVCLLLPLGDIANVRDLEEPMRVKLNLPYSIVVQFKRFDPGRDVLRTFGRHRIFKVQAYDEKKLDPEANQRNDDDHVMAQYDRDRRSAFFGNLPLSMTEGKLTRLANLWGKVLSVDLKRKLVPASPDRTIEICFGFVEFTRPDAANDVVNAYHGMNLDGHTIRVQRKISRLFETSRHSQQQEHPQTPFSQSSAQHLTAGSTPQGSQAPQAPQRPATLGGTFGARDVRSFTTPVAAYDDYSPSPDVYVGGEEGGEGAYHHHHHGVRHTSHTSVSSGVSAGPAPPESSAVTFNKAATPKEAKSKTSEEVKTKAKADRTKAKQDAATTGLNTGDPKGKGKGKAAALSPTPTTTGSVSQPYGTSPNGYHMMTPALPPYGYAAAMHPLMHHPITPQGPVFYPNSYPNNGYSGNGYASNGFSSNGYSNNGYPSNGFSGNGYASNGYSGYSYSPMPTPMEPLVYSQYLDSMMASYSIAETPTRPTNFVQPGSGSGDPFNATYTPSAFQGNNGTFGNGFVQETRADYESGAQSSKNVESKGKGKERAQ